MEEIAKNKGGRPVKYTYELTKPLVDNWLEFAKSQTFDKVIFDQKAGEQKTIKLIKPLTIYSFCLHSGMDYKTYQDIICSDYTSEQCIYSKELIQLITRVNETIKDNQLSGAILNEYNATIVARLNGLNETVEVNNTGNAPLINISLPSMPKAFGSINETNIEDATYKEVKPTELPYLNT